MDSSAILEFGRFVFRKAFWMGDDASRQISWCGARRAQGITSSPKKEEKEEEEVEVEVSPMCPVRSVTYVSGRSSMT